MTKLTQYRISRGMTQQALSNLSGVNIRQIQRVEGGSSAFGNLSAKNAIAISDALGVDIHYLMEGYKIMVKNRNGTEIDFEAATQMMDDAIREKLHSECADDTTEQEFFTKYEAAHEAIFGAEWELSKANPVW